MGVYETQACATTATRPCPRDVTAGVHPCVINHGINGGRLPPVTRALLPLSLQDASSLLHDPAEVIHPTLQCGDPFTMDSGPTLQQNGFAAMNGYAHDEHCDSELSEMIAMEQESHDPGDHGDGPSAFGSPALVMNGFGNGDVTLHQGVSTNRIAVAGKKRCREESDEVEHKRMRKNGQ